MKYALSALSIFVLFGCEKPVDNEGYVAGYKLTCGFKWDAGNQFVLDKEFAYNFLAGSRECVRKHPELARNVLGLASASQVMPAREAETPGKLTPIAPKNTATGVGPSESTKAPVTTKASVESAPPAKPQPAKSTKAPARAAVPVKAKAPAKAKSAEKPKAPAKSKVAATPQAPVKAKAPPQPKAPVRTKAPAEVVDATSISGKPSVPAPESAPPPLKVEPRQQIRRKESDNSYELFMGD